MVTPVNILDSDTCDEAVTAIEEGADVLVTREGSNIIHLLAFELDKTCIERLFNAVGDDETKKSLLRAKNDLMATPYAIAFVTAEVTPELLIFMTELADSLGILQELIGKQEKRGIFHGEYSHLHGFIRVYPAF